MSKRLEEALAQEIYKHDLFPCILHYREQSESFEYIAEQLNNDGIPTWRGRPWCRQNLERTFKNYWRSRGWCVLLAAARNSNQSHAGCSWPNTSGTRRINSSRCCVNKLINQSLTVSLRERKEPDNEGPSAISGRSDNL